MILVLQIADDAPNRHDAQTPDFVRVPFLKVWSFRLIDNSLLQRKACLKSTNYR